MPTSQASGSTTGDLLCGSQCFTQSASLKIRYIWNGTWMVSFQPKWKISACYGPRKFISEFEFALQCTTGLVPQAISFHDLCKQIVWCYQGASSHGSLLCWRHADVCVFQSKQKHRAIWGCHCYSALCGWSNDIIKEKVFLKEKPCFKFFLSIAIKNGYVWYLVY